MYEILVWSTNPQTRFHEAWYWIHGSPILRYQTEILGPILYYPNTYTGRSIDAKSVRGNNRCSPWDECEKHKYIQRPKVTSLAYKKSETALILSLCPSVDLLRTALLHLHVFPLYLILERFLKSVHQIQVQWKSVKNNSHFTWRPVGQ
jgi:hypothetical protein